MSGECAAQRPASPVSFRGVRNSKINGSLLWERNIMLVARGLGE